MLDELKEDPLAEKVVPIKIKSEQLPKYEPVIGINWRRYHSYDLRLVGLKEALTFPTRLESTTQVFVHGHDLFLSRMMPDNGYDLLDEDFTYIGLFIVIVVIIIGDIALSKLQKRNDVMKTFLDRKSVV